ncbi:MULTISPECIES: sugar ABC transporter ATP-binding protein [Oceanotoga]|uniref:Monosaccharide ABC transporter ATP-binding protein (CUT2 family) n=1 Tax=Oceanotoga teriensis TaxID=515440 RepID=A0AA45HHM7_9BACT|nr:MULTISPECIES: sugar ABC transporter ATP-binding protein [Oceanotoga]MDN5342756.1 ribose transport system ATP-binding protein [Oceanotoga sp.]MDO7975780.1 sugar ABC transporter ATP-binding protein [Oceanotoga teriensis]PWJ84718.1 monosaccharide ABC transporter ATP-binding protein (CUT2 family) [Oceanotoga teriensis]
MKILLNMKNISKSFSKINVLNNVNLKIEEGKVLGLLGENGAGKSTLMKILSGVYKKDEGIIIFEDKEINPQNPKEVQTLGISIIYQELNLIDNMSVAENIYLGRWPLNVYKKINYKCLYENTEKLLKENNLNLNSKDIVGNLSVGKKQMVEIAKAISFNSKIILMDEPTSALSNDESEKLFNIIESLKEKGVGIVFISHKMEEIYRICDKVKVLRDGKDMGEKEINNVTEKELIKMMVGRDIEDRFPKKNNEIGETILEVKNLTSKKVKNISFNVRQGEVFGIAGLMGAGRTETMRAIFGIDKIFSGEVYLKGKKISIKNPEIAIKNGIGFVPEDRKKEGLILDFSVLQNSVLAILNKIKNIFGYINHKEEIRISNNIIENLEVKTNSNKQIIKYLSGGNQQKVIIGKWLEIKPDILILDDPTRGIDVGTKAQIYSLINNITRKGKSVILISSELPEVVNMCDRVMVMHEGELMKVLNKDEISQERIMYYAIGKKGAI